MLLQAGVTTLCMTVLWIPMFSEAADVYMTLTSLTGTYIYLFSENNFKKLYECLCQSYKFCFADFSKVNGKSYHYKVDFITSSFETQTYHQASSCRYYVCRAGNDYIYCSKIISELRLVPEKFTQIFNYRNTSMCPNLCATFFWSYINDQFSSSSDLLAECNNSCRGLTSTALTVRTSTTTAVRTSTRKTGKTTRGSTSTTKPMSTYITTQQSLVLLTSPQLPNNTLTVNVTSSVNQMEENSSIIIVAVVVPLLIAIIVGVFLVAFLWRRRKLSKQELLRQNVHGRPVVVPSTSTNKEPGNTYLSLNSQRKIQKKQQSEENTSSYDYVDFTDTSGNMNTVANNFRCTIQSNSSKGVYLNADNLASSLQNRHIQSSTTIEDIADKRIVYFPDRNSRDESDDACRSVYSLAACDNTADSDIEIKLIKKKQAINTEPKENKNAKNKNTDTVLEQANSLDYGSPYMEIDNTNNGYTSVIEGSLVTKNVTKAKINPILSVPTTDEIYVYDKKPSITLSGSGTYNNIAFEPESSTQIHLDVQQDDTNDEEESPGYYYSSNAGIIQNIAKEIGAQKDLSEKSSRTPTSGVDKGNNPPSDVDTEYSVANLSDHEQMCSTNPHVYSRLRDEEVHIFHPYNSLQLQNE